MMGRFHADLRRWLGIKSNLRALGGKVTCTGGAADVYVVRQKALWTLFSMPPGGGGRR